MGHWGRDRETDPPVEQNRVENPDTDLCILETWYMRDLAWQITEETGVRQLVGTDKNQFPVYEGFKMKGKTLQLLKERIGK